MLDEGEIRLPGRDTVVRFPARVQLLLLASSCPCAAAHPDHCTCAPAALDRYRARLGGPVPDRVDISVRLDPLERGGGGPANGSSAVVRERVIAARAAAAHRWHEFGVATNASIPGPVLRRRFSLPSAAADILDTAVRDGGISARGAEQIVRVAWTLCDLRGAPHLSTGDLTRAAALYRPRR